MSINNILKNSIEIKNKDFNFCIINNPKNIIFNKYELSFLMFYFKNIYDSIYLFIDKKCYIFYFYKKYQGGLELKIYYDDLFLYKNNLYIISGKDKIELNRLLKIKKIISN